jgi:hypothetical protein
MDWSPDIDLGCGICSGLGDEVVEDFVEPCLDIVNVFRTIVL